MSDLSADRSIKLEVSLLSGRGATVWKDELAARCIKFEVSSPSGRRETVTVSQYGTIADLKVAEQQSLGQQFLRLASPGGRLLDPTRTIQFAGLKDADSLTAVAQQPKIAATRSAFAVWCVGVGRVATWGHTAFGGDSS